VEREKIAGEECCIGIIPGDNQLIIGKDKRFTFDYIYPPRVQQTEVFETSVSSLVDAWIDGFNATVFPR
jgi:hypothetical protein